MNGLAESVAHRGPDSLHLRKALLAPFRVITVNRKVAKLLSVGSDVCAR